MAGVFIFSLVTSVASGVWYLQSCVLYLTKFSQIFASFRVESICFLTKLAVIDFSDQNVTYFAEYSIINNEPPRTIDFAVGVSGQNVFTT